ncbi:hypothetical protein TrLO_g6615 [Triparma laevis f. longispina]|uniref:Uncharacterized protein n=1 Tax=Triparma laevis f. longispina TaxID=1714387 RepID=A0A9W6ZM51_9STRA|nr:hypothetical protein TrLO_g6615 [Triparma laevis f. longispina]
MCKSVYSETLTTDQFMHTPEFNIHFVGLVHVETLMALRVATKGWNAAADALIDEGVRSGELMVHDRYDIIDDDAFERVKSRNRVTRMIFFLHITEVGKFACYSAANLAVVDIPEGVKSIGKCAFSNCESLTTVYFLTTLITTCESAYCSVLENVDLRHTNLQELGECAFGGCSELKSMMIPDSLQTLGRWVFDSCSKLVPSNIDICDEDAVVAYLRSKQNQS